MYSSNADYWEEFEQQVAIGVGAISQLLKGGLFHTLRKEPSGTALLRAPASACSRPIPMTSIRIEPGWALMKK